MAIGIQQTDNMQKDAFDEFLDTLNQPREVMSSPEDSQYNDQDQPDIEEDPELDPVLEKKKLEVAMIPAQTVVDCIDLGFTSINSMIAMEHQEGASDEEKESLKNATANWLRETNIDLSPGKMLLFLVLMIYAPKTVQAFQTRKENQRIKALALENEELKSQLQQQREMQEQMAKEMEQQKVKEQSTNEVPDK